MSKHVKRALVAVAVLAVLGAGVCVAARYHRKHWDRHRPSREGRQGQLLQQLCPDPKVKGNFYQAAAVLQVGKGVDPLPVACRLVSAACLQRAVESAEVQECLGGPRATNWEVLRSRMKVRIVEDGPTRLVVVYVGGFDKPAKALKAADAVASACEELVRRQNAAQRQSQIAIMKDEIAILTARMDSQRREAHEICREAAVPQMAQRETMMAGRMSEEQREMLGCSLRTEEITRSLEALRNAVATKSLDAMPELLKRVSENADLRAIRAEVLKRQIELAESKGAGEAPEKVQGMEKRLAGLQELLRQTSERVLAQTVAEHQRDMETELGRVRSHRIKLETVFREDQATLRDLVERQSVLADRIAEVEALRQKISRLDDKRRDLQLADRAEERTVWVLDTFSLPKAGAKPLPLPKPAAATKPATASQPATSAERRVIRWEQPLEQK